MEISQDKLIKTIRKRISKLDKRRIEHHFSLARNEEVSEEVVRERIKILIECIGKSAFPIAQRKLYRCTTLKEGETLPEELDRLLSPPPEYARRNRCNLENKPLLYVSQHPAVLIDECHLTEGDKFIILQFDLNTLYDDLYCCMYGMAPESELSGESRVIEHERNKKSIYGRFYNRLKLIEYKLHQEFVRDDDPSGITYRVTSNLAD